MVMDGRDRLTELDKRLIGGSRRIIIPLDNRYLLRDVADALRGLAQVMDIHSRLSEMDAKNILIRVKHEIRHTNTLIREASKACDIKLQDGRPTDKERLAQTRNAEATEPPEEPENLHHLDIRRTS